MVTGLLEHAVLWLNAFPSENAEIKNTSPSTLVTGTPQPDFNKRRVPFGSYIMAYKGTKNDMSARAIPSIALRESNEFRGFYFLSLETGKRFHSKNGIHCRSLLKSLTKSMSLPIMIINQSRVRVYPCLKAHLE